MGHSNKSQHVACFEFANFFGLFPPCGIDTTDEFSNLILLTTSMRVLPERKPFTPCCGLDFHPWIVLFLSSTRRTLDLIPFVELCDHHANPCWRPDKALIFLAIILNFMVDHLSESYWMDKNNGCHPSDQFDR